METQIQTEVKTSSFDLEGMREQLRNKRGQAYWRTLEEVAQTPEFEKFLEDEFPNRSSLFEVDRRSLLKFMGASLALAGLSGCRGVFLPEDKIVPYVKAPEEMIPGKPLFYASAVLLAGYATGVVVEQHEGRPIKLEGNEFHPASLGALDAISQAEILNFYDPDRQQNVIDRGDVSTWELYFKAVGEVLNGAKEDKGASIGIVTGASTSPTFGRLLQKFRNRYPAARIYSYEPTGRAETHKSVAEAFGVNGVPVYDFSKAKVVLSLDSDFFSPVAQPGSLKYAREFAEQRRIVGKSGSMNRLYAIESTVSLVGAMADHRYPVKPSEVYAAALAIASKLGISVPSATVPPSLQAEIDVLVQDLQANAQQSIVIAGEHHSAELQALVHQINARLGNVGKTVMVLPTPEVTAGLPGITELTADLLAGKITYLHFINSNPVYNAPADLKFADALKMAKVTVHHGQYSDETAALCQWQIPMTHSLEEWGDARAFDGTASIVQPIIAPLFEGRSAIEVLSALLGEPKGGYDLVRETWANAGTFGADFEGGWRKSIHDGVIANTKFAPVAAAIKAPNAAPAKPASGLEVLFLADPNIHDGRFANNGWLQELPKPLSKMVWDNVVMIAPKDAEQLGVVTDDLVSLSTGSGTVEAAVYIQPGMPSGTVTVHLGYGRTSGGSIATISGDDGGGFNAYLLRGSASMTFVDGATLAKAKGQRHLASTQGHSPLGGNRVTDHRDIIRSGTLAEFLEKGPKVLQHGHSLSQDEIRENNLYPEEIFQWDGPAWGMTIDMNTCVGCNACVTACQAENNISVVGKEQVGRNREMHWLRIDRYYSGDDENPEVVWQPVACVHCEKAPCEPVCPVAATVHSHEGLNQMVYNRCVGTRYCSNNCPYKVRRFNFLNYSDNQAQFSNTQWKNRLIPGPIKSPKEQGVQLLKMLNNPDVTVRGRGVMEKCTYCVQRINEARIEAKKANRDIKDGDIVTACQQACPTQSIVFGNIADKESAVAKLRQDPRSYLLLEELQTRPRTSHLAKLKNPHPSLVKASAHSGEHGAGAGEASH